MMIDSLFSLGMLRLGIAVPEMRIADVDFNVEKIIELIEQGKKQGCQLLLFPELAITGYTCADLFYQELLLHAAEKALIKIAGYAINIALVIGAPLRARGRLYNCAVFFANGRMIGAVPKTYLPTTREFYEKRWFSRWDHQFSHVEIAGKTVEFGSDLLFRCSSLPDCIVGIEICEDMWGPSPPSSSQAAAGATLLLNLSASPELVAKKEFRQLLVCSQSARCLAAYGYACAGPNESTTDLVFSGHSIIAENGLLMVETKVFQFESQIVMADIDFQQLGARRIKDDTFAASWPENKYRIFDFSISDISVRNIHRRISPTPFVPGQARRADRCREVFSIQTTALAKRLRHTHCSTAIIGISGGLDSTLALLVTIKAFDNLGWKRKQIIAVTMPGFGTTKRTKTNAEKLAHLLGVSLRVISITKAVKQHFQDIGHDGTLDITYENSQARERTQILMDLANRLGGLVIGTGDLSELALGWCTYNGDHISMYSVNAGVPKTLARSMVEWCAQSEFNEEAGIILQDICATPVSPELLPPTSKGDIKQRTEDKIGPYLLHDFFLYHAIYLQAPPRKVYQLAQMAFDNYGQIEILHWLENFYCRFFQQQFKRSCLPDGPKIGTVSLSPRGDWRMASDAIADLWLTEIKQLKAERKSCRNK